MKLGTEFGGAQQGIEAVNAEMKKRDPNGVGSALRVSNTSIVSNSSTGISVTGGGKLMTLGGNVLSVNGANGAFTDTEAKQ